MLASYKHLGEMPDHTFQDRTFSLDACLNYKQLVGKESAYQDLRAMNYQTLTSMIVHHLRKAELLLEGHYELPSKDNYLDWDYKEVFEHQCTLAEQEKLVSVLNTSVFVPVDYQPSNFFNQVQTHRNQFLI